MNQIIAPKSINFKELVKNSNTTLSLNLETKMINILNTEFTEEEQQWYIANLYIYMNYHPTNDYPINLEDIFHMIGFANKGNAKRTLDNNFTKDEDYKITILPSEKGQIAREDIMLNVDTFKNLCMLAKTDKGKEIRKYYVKLENIYNQIIKEEIEEKNELLQEQQKKIELLENKPKTHGFLARRHGYVYMITDRSKLGHYKIGMTYNVDKRLRNLNTSSSGKSLSVYHEIETYDCELLEKTLHSILQPFNICGRREWFFFCNEKEVKYALHTMNKTHNYLNAFNFTSHEQFLDYINKETMEILPTTNTEIIEQHLENQEAQVAQEDQVVEEKQEQQLEEQVENKVIAKVTKTIRKKKQENIIKETNIFKLTGQQLSNKTGNYKGVCWSKEKQKWKAELKMAYKIAFLGYYYTELEGAIAYNDYATYINNKDNTNYALNDILNYIPNPRDIPEEHKNEIDENKSSQYNGVSYYKSRKHYVAGIKYAGKTYGLGSHKEELECAKLYNQQAMYFNNQFKTNYILNDIPGYITIPKNIHQEIQDKKVEKKSSQYYGVTFCKRSDKYRSVLVHNKKQIHIGFFEIELDAAKAYNNKALELNTNNKTQYKLNNI